ncbi:MAG: hypothetical protein ABSB63_21875 [Spirochaetia bacterium]
MDLEALQPWSIPDKSARPPRKGLKAAQLFIFAYIERLCKSKSAKVEKQRLPEDPSFTWVAFEPMLDSLPCLRMKYDALKDAVDGLVSSGLVERKTRNFQKDRRSYFRITQAYDDRVEALDRAAKKSQGEKTTRVNIPQGEKAHHVERSQREKSTQPQGEKTTQDRKSNTGRYAAAEPLPAPLAAQIGRAVEARTSREPVASAGGLSGASTAAAVLELMAKPEQFITDPEQIRRRELRKCKLEEQARLLAATDSEENEESLFEPEDDEEPLFPEVVNS